jgi:hypothetical protein
MPEKMTTDAGVYEASQRHRHPRAGFGSRDHGCFMDNDPLPVRAPAVVAAYLLAALCLLIPLAVLGSTFAGMVLWRRGQRPHGAAVVGLGLACLTLGVTALR